MKELSFQKYWLFLILLVAAVLRFWRIWDLEYSYDELSAILRATKAQNWYDHIHLGVLPDGHPALVQTLIWLIGDHVTLLKCIAAGFGTGAVYFAYRAGRSAFSPATGLVAATLMAVLYLPVFWSQQVRPYAFGMFFSTALLWTFSQIVFEKDQRKILYLRFALLAALCAYTHYFSALFAALLYVTFLLASAKRIKYLLISALISLLLFLPHITITLGQLKEGGLGWLGKPNATFFWEHLLEIFSSSGYLLSIIGIFLITGSAVIWRSQSQIPWQKVIVYFLFFFTPILIGYLYSIVRSPVLQNSVLLFSLPPLLIIIGYVISQTPVKLFYVQLLVISICGIAVLIQNKKHYTLGYREPWSSAVKYIKEHPQQEYAVNAPRDIFEYYLKKFNTGDKTKFHYIFSEGESVTLKKARWYADSFHGKFILSSGTDPAFIGIYEELSCNYKVAMSETSWIGAEIPQFEYRGCTGGDLSINGIPFNYFPYAWTGNSINISLDSLTPSPNDALIICYTPDSSLRPTGEIQTALFNGDKIIDWRSTNLPASPQGINGLYYHTIKLADIPLWNKKTKLVLRLESPYKSGRFRVRISKGNPYLYGVD